MDTSSIFTQHASQFERQEVDYNQEPQPAPGDTDHSDYYERALQGDLGEVRRGDDLVDGGREVGRVRARGDGKGAHVGERVAAARVDANVRESEPLGAQRGRGAVLDPRR